MAISPSRSAAQRAVRSLARQGMTGSAALDQLREWDLGYRVQDFYSDWRQHQSQIARAERFQAARSDTRPRSGMIEYTPWMLGERYSYEVQVTSIDPDTGLGVRRGVQVLSESLLTKAEVEKKVLPLLERGAYKEAETYESAEVVRLMGRDIRWEDRLG